MANFLRVCSTLWLCGTLGAFAQGAPLRFTTPPIYSRKIPEGSSVDLSCELNDRKVPVSLWQMMSNGRMFTPRKNVAKYGQIFILHWVTKNTEGTYLCRLRRPPFSHNIGRISVTKQTKDPPPSPRVRESEKNVFLHGNVSLTCKATGKKIESVWWYKWAQRLPSQQQLIKRESSAIRGDTWTNTLTLKNVQKNQSGWYECRVFETDLNYGFWSTHVKLNVRDRTSCPALDGEFADPERNTGYLRCKGGIVTRMNCSEGLVWRNNMKACGLPVKLIRWRGASFLKRVKKTVGDSVIFDCRLTNTTIRVKLSQRIRSGKFIERYPDGCRIHRTGQIFVIHSVNLNDVGIYYCEAPDAKMKKKPHSYLDVHPALRSVFDYGHRNLFASLGSSLDLNCGAFEVFKPRIYLEIIRADGITQLIPDNNKVTLLDRILTIHGLDSNMQGKIVCKVVSSCAQMREDVDLGFIVSVPLKGDPPIPALSPEASVAKEGDTVVINCTVSVKTEIRSIEWFKDKKLVSNHAVDTSGTGSLLTLRNVTKSDAGEYECRVIDFGVGYWLKSAFVQVEDKEVTTTQTTTSTLAHTTPSTNATTAKLPLILMRPYRPVDIPCDMLLSKTKISLWQKSLEGILSQRKPDGLSLVLQNNVFTITYGRKSDRGEYYCQEGVSAMVPIGSLTFEVASSRVPLWIPKTFLVVEYMGGADIVCIIDSTVPAKWSMWLKANQGDSTNERQSNRHTVVATTSGMSSELVLQIRNASIDDTGTYVCRAKFTDGSVQEKIAKVKVKETSKAQILLNSGLQIINESQSAEFWCKVSGSPRPKITWQRHGQSLGECGLRWGAINCESFSERHELTFRNDTSFLRVSEAKFFDDAGSYSCYVENLAGAGNATLQLTIQVKPVITKNDSKKYIRLQESDSISLPCVINHSSPTPTISWWIQTCSIPCNPSPRGWTRMETADTSSLRIPPSNDHALYKCTAENLMGYDDLIYTVTRQPDVKPPVITHFEPKILAKASQTTRILCEAADAELLFDVEWFKDGVQVGVCEAVQRNTTCRIHGDEAKYKLIWKGSGTELTIWNVHHPFDSGNFTCVVKNIGGMDAKTALLDVHEKPVLNKKNATDFRILAFGDATTIQSTALRGHPIPYFTWFQQPVTKCVFGCKPDASQWRRVPRSAISPSAQVPSRFSSLFLPPARSGYFFRCFAENSLGHDDVVYLVHRIDSKTILPEIIPAKPILRVDEGSSFHLQCQARAGDFQILTWEKRNGRRSAVSSEFRRNQYNLTTTISVAHAEIDDSGEYHCVGWTNNATRISVIVVEVNEFIAPVVSLSNKTINELQTNRTSLHCKVTSGYPEPNITWYKDGAKLSLHAFGSQDNCRINGYHYKEKDQHRGNLVICKPSHVINTGLYKCVANNIEGQDFSEAFLNVLAPPNIIRMENKVARDLGESVNVTCRATGNPAPSVNWITKTVSGPVSSLDLDNQTLQINNIQEEHFKEYVCLAKNRFGNDTLAFALVKRTTIGAVTRQQSSSNTSFIVAIFVSVVLFILLVLVAVILYRRRQLYGGFYICTTPPLPDLIARLDASIPLIEQVNKLPYDKRWEFPREHLQFGRVIGSGAFGEVHLAEVDGIISNENSKFEAAPRPRLSLKRDLRRASTLSVKGPVKVAVKTLKEGADEVEHKDLQSELKILIHIGSHKNIVNLLGACTKGSYGDLCVIIEYCPYGNLLQFLRNRRELYQSKWQVPTTDPDKQFTLTDLVSAAFQVTRAMEFLASRKCVHRDLAARNVLVASNYVVKVADFGLARDVYKNDQYIKISPGLVPVKWMAIESLIDRVYSEQSDVWSFGVFLWELFTLGGSPYPGLPPTEIYQFIMDGNRMDQPLDCPDQMYQMMRDCWMEKAEDRPNFAALVQRLENTIASNMPAMGLEGYLELELDESSKPDEAETDCDGYLKPVDFPAPAIIKKPAFLLNESITGSEKELHGSNRSVASESKIKEFLEVERYTELGFKPSSSANSLIETIL